MPTKRIEVSITGKGTCRSSGNYVEVSPRGIGINPYPPVEPRTYLAFSLQKKISDTLPENTKIKNIDFHFYTSDVGPWRENKTHNIYNGNSHSSAVLSLVRDGWNSFNVSNLDPESTLYMWAFEKGEFRDWREESNDWAWENALTVRVASSDTPYLEVEYEYNPPIPPKSLVPNGGTYNPRTPIRFSWNSEINQTRFELQYKVNSGSWKTITRTSKDRYYEMPENTIAESEGKLYWRVRVAEESGVYSDFVDASFILGAVKQAPPRLIAPIGTYQENNKPVVFEWYFISDTLEKQKSWELQYSKGDSTSWETIKGDGEIERATLDVKDWDSMVIRWKMRVTNDFGDTSEWTEIQKFQIIGAPPIPQILGVSNSNMPLITWNSREQEIYQIQITRDGEIVYDTLKKVSKEKKHQVTKILQDDKYICKLIVYNAFSVASPVAEFTFIINSEGLELPEIKVLNGEYYVTVISESENATVLRDGVRIGSIKDGAFKDYTGRNNVLHRYQVVDFKDGSYSSSIEKAGKIHFFKNSISTLNEPEKYLKIYYMLDGHLSSNIDLSYEMSSIFIDGRKYPVFEVGNCETEIKSIKFYTSNYVDFARLISQKEEILYREANGTNFIGMVTGISIEENVHGYIVSFSLMKTGEI